MGDEIEVEAKLTAMEVRVSEIINLGTKIDKLTDLVNNINLSTARFYSRGTPSTIQPQRLGNT